MSKRALSARLAARLRSLLAGRRRRGADVDMSAVLDDLNRHLLRDIGVEVPRRERREERRRTW